MCGLGGRPNHGQSGSAAYAASRAPQTSAELAKQSITIEANATEDGHLYGSVGAAEIVAALKANDVHLSTDQIRLEGPLKELGLYTVKVRYSSEVEGELKVWVVPTVATDAS